MRLMRETSINAYRNLIMSGQSKVMGQKIYDSLKDSGGRTRNELSRDTGMAINCICGRVNELIKYDLLKEGDQVSCSITGHKAYLVQVA